MLTAWCSLYSETLYPKKKLYINLTKTEPMYVHVYVPISMCWFNVCMAVRRTAKSWHYGVHPSGSEYPQHPLVCCKRPLNVPGPLSIRVRIGPPYLLACCNRRLNAPGPVSIRVRIGPQHPLVSCKRRLKKDRPVRIGPRSASPCVS
jgi:hypothetical protein